MRVQIAVIKLVLRTNKTLADGTHPIMLRVSFNGMKEKSTGYSCSIKSWDKKNEMVRKGYPNWVMVNAELKRQKDEAIRRRDEYIAFETLYTPQMILDKPEVKQTITGELTALISDYIQEKQLRKKTIDNWRYSERLIKEFGINHVQELSLEKTKSFARWLTVNKKLSEGVAKTVLQKVSAIATYAVTKGIMKQNPMDNWKYAKELKTSSKMEYIHWQALDLMKEMLMDDIIVRNGTRWSYKGDAFMKLIDRNSDLFARYLYMLMVLFQGLAPVDICHIRREEIEVKTINNQDYYCWDGKRHKTQVAVKVRIPCHTVYTEVMIRTMLMFNQSEWFLPVLNGLTSETPEDKRKKRISNCLVTLSPKLKEWFVQVNVEIAKKNVTDKCNIPLVDARCTYYSARHSFAMAYMSKGGSPLGLATLLGRAINTLSQYVKELSAEGDLVDAVSIIV